MRSLGGDPSTRHYVRSTGLEVDVLLCVLVLHPVCSHHEFGLSVHIVLIKRRGRKQTKKQKRKKFELNLLRLRA